MNQDMNDQLSIDLDQIKSAVTSINNLPISSHSTEFEKIHKQLQQALTNLDGV
jgi:pimeloyl-CoA synthetase